MFQVSVVDLDQIHVYSQDNSITCYTHKSHAYNDYV